MYFYTSSLLRGKLPRAFDSAVGEEFCDAQCQLEMKNGFASTVGVGLSVELKTVQDCIAHGSFIGCKLFQRSHQ